MEVDMTDPQYSKVLVKALRILDNMCSSQSEVSIRGISRELGMDPATVHRFMRTFHALDYVEQNPISKRYTIGPTVMKLASAYSHHNPLPTIAKKVFESYSDRFEYNFYLGALYHSQVVYLAVLDGRGPIKVVVEPGATLDLHCTALGKTLLAFQEESYVREYLSTHNLQKHTPRTITQSEEFISHLRTVRENGYAINDGEYYNDVGAIGVPIYNQIGEVSMSVSLTYPRILLQEGRLHINEMVLLANEIVTAINLRMKGDV